MKLFEPAINAAKGTLKYLSDLVSPITKMIDNIGLLQTIKSLGGYNNFIKLIPDYFESKSNKIKLIREITLKEEDEIIRFHEISINEEDLEIYIEEKPNGDLIQWLVVEVDVEVAWIKGIYLNDDFDEVEDDSIELENLKPIFLNEIFSAIINYYL
jgi:hypothetical protein